MPFILANEDAGLSPDTTAESIDSYVPAGGQIGIDWIKPCSDGPLAMIKLAGPYTHPDGLKPIEKGAIRYLKPSRFTIPEDAWIRPAQPQASESPARTEGPSPPGGKSLLPPEVAALNHYYEGCRLEAYPDPGTGGLPITIGWGSTFYKDSSPIKLGDRITQAEADELYDFNCYNKYWKALVANVPKWSEMSDKQRAALCSFAYNNGADFYGGSGHSTITRNLRERDWRAVPGSLMMYRNPGDKVEVGLGRRRRAEGLVWIGVDPKTACRQAEREINTPADCERYEQLLKSNPPAIPSPSQSPSQSPIIQSEEPAATQQAKAAVASGNPLGIWMPQPGVNDFTIPVKHYTQVDNSGGRGYRECFKTSCTMLADYVTNGKLSEMRKQKGLPEPEDVYQSFMDGDTTDASVHVRALKRLGIDAYFTTSASIKDVEASLNRGIPVPIGVKYKPNSPGGGGHWVVVNGRGPKGWDVLCPYGIRNGSSDAWIQIFQAESDAKADNFSLGLLGAIFTDLGPENGYAIFVTAVNGIATGVANKL
jgi:GH24 family phage-related lysozyme (muramidase)